MSLILPVDETDWQALSELEFRILRHTPSNHLLYHKVRMSI